MIPRLDDIEKKEKLVKMRRAVLSNMPVSTDLHSATMRNEEVAKFNVAMLRSIRSNNLTAADLENLCAIARGEKVFDGL